MERLTHRLRADCITVEGTATYYSPYSKAGMSRAITKLAEYEDSGLTPKLAAAAGLVGREVWTVGSPDGYEFRVEHGKVCSVEFTMRTILCATVAVLFDDGSFADTIDPDDVYLTEEIAQKARDEFEKRWKGELNRG